MSRSEERHRQKVEARSLHARRVERVDQLKRERDLAMKKLWDKFQARISAARASFS